MNAATLTAFRERFQQRENGDRMFLIECSLDRCGQIARFAYDAVEIEFDSRGDRLWTTETETRMADRVIELVNGADVETDQDPEQVLEVAAC